MIGIGSYCSQSSRYDTATTASKLVQLDPVLEAARKAKENGSTRFCMGAAWRDLKGRKSGFERCVYAFLGGDYPSPVPELFTLLGVLVRVGSWRWSQRFGAYFECG